MASDGSQLPGLPEPLSVPTPEQVAMAERFIVSFRSPFSVPLLLEPRIETALSSLLEADNADAILAPLTGDDQRAYAIACVDGTVALWFFEGARDEDTIIGYLNACLMRRLAERYPDLIFTSAATTTAHILASYAVFAQMRRAVEQALRQAGWRLDCAFIRGTEQPLVRPAKLNAPE